MKSKEELIDIIAQAIGGHLAISPDHAIDAASAALKALCGALPDVHMEHKHNTEKNILNTIAECAANYCELVQWGER